MFYKVEVDVEGSFMIFREFLLRLGDLLAWVENVEKSLNRFGNFW